MRSSHGRNISVSRRMTAGEPEDYPEMIRSTGQDSHNRSRKQKDKEELM